MRIELSDRITAHAAATPDREALIFVADPDVPDEARTLTYAELHDAARATAATLRAGLGAGDRVMLLYPPGLEFGVAFLGCLYAGVVPIANPVPDGQRHRGERLSAVVRNAGAVALLTDEGSAPAVRDWAAGALPGLPCHVTGVPTGRPPGDWRPPAADPDRVLFLQYTSGSTSDPRGVGVTAANLAANAEAFLRMTGTDRHSRSGGWVPMHHDMGLVGLFLAPLHLGGTSVQMPASTFLRHPQSWLRLIDRFDVDTSAAPNFAYEMCVRRIEDHHVQGLDLSRWTVAMNGSEPVRAATIRRFQDRFRPYGLRPDTLSPGYGLAEATLAVSCSGRGRPTRITAVDPARLARGDLRVVDAAGAAPRELVGCGPVVSSDLRIVDPDTRVGRPDGRVGEIWLRGPSVTGGYWGNPAASAATFGAVTADGEGGFLRTGDLGVRHDGELYVTGRIKEVLIVHGRNLYPQDLEAEARLAHETLAAGGFGAAFTVTLPAQDQEHVVLVHEVRTGRAGTGALPGIAGAVRRQLSREFGVSASVLLVRPGGVPRTTSGKIQRVAVRTAFLNRELSALHGDLTPEVHAHQTGTGR